MHLFILGLILEYIDFKGSLDASLLFRVTGKLMPLRYYVHCVLCEQLHIVRDLTVKMRFNNNEMRLALRLLDDDYKSRCIRNFTVER